jgi:glucose/arabinose dehydrogenase
MQISRAALVSSMALAIVAAGCAPRSSDSTDTTEAQASGDTTPSRAADCAPLETRDPNAASQRPAFASQTRACGIRSDVAFDVTVLARGLAKPWAVEPLSGGDLLVTEKPGRLRIISATGEMGDPITGILQVDSRGQGGLLDIALSPDFDSDRTIFWSFSEPREGGNGTSVARGALSADRRRLEDVRVIFRAMPTYDGNLHFGSRLTFGPDSMLYVTLGERSNLEIRPHAQQLNSHMGKILRINPADGSAPPDNPFVGQANARPEIWTLGHRNVLAAALDGRGRLWVTEMGPRGGDELNLVERGKDYGWPTIGYGEEYSGARIHAATQAAGMEQPVYYWDPVISPSGMTVYSGELFPEWRGNFLVGGLSSKALVRLVVEGDRVVGEERLLTHLNARIREVVEGPDGALYLLTDAENGRLLKVTPKAAETRGAAPGQGQPLEAGAAAR